MDANYIKQLENHIDKLEKKLSSAQEKLHQSNYCYSSHYCEFAPSNRGKPLGYFTLVGIFKKLDQCEVDSMEYAKKNMKIGGHIWIIKRNLETQEDFLIKRIKRNKKNFFEEPFDDLLITKI